MAKIEILKIKEIIDALLEFVKLDYETKLDANLVEDSFIYRILDASDVVEDVSYRDLAVEIFTRTNKKSNKVETRLMFDVDRATLPTIHFREPAVNKGKSDGIGGLGIGYLDNHIYAEDVKTNDGFTILRQRSFEGNYEMMITSANRHEVLIMSEIITGLLVGAQDTLANIFQTFEFSKKELIANNELIPDPLFIKSIMIRAHLDKIYPDLMNNEIVNKLLFKSNPE